ncbi:MAG: class I SAM-dependent methyltransferase [Dehalococcoidales bacterium]|nr:class I SAM-dependent methyltransferase [Dehalococcoidales bacterium]
MERKRYIKEVYSKWWPDARKKQYGFLEYDKNLCDYICQHVPGGSKLLEVAIGTGYPIADYLQKAGYVIHGIDLSPDLIEQCRKLNPNIKCKVGDAENLEYEDNYFNATYCFHSTWHFPDLNKTIDEMVRVTCPGGMIIFDVLNRSNSEIEAAHQKNIARGKGIKRAVTFIRNFIGMILGKRAFNWHFLFHYVVHEVPIYPQDVLQHLRDKGINGVEVMVRQADGTISAADNPGPLPDFPRLVFVIKRNG